MDLTSDQISMLSKSVEGFVEFVCDYYHMDKGFALTYINNITREQFNTLEEFYRDAGMRFANKVDNLCSGIISMFRTIHEMIGPPPDSSKFNFISEPDE